ncbi:MAG: Macrolide export ATP-binding/permease protein MacB [Labilithrix sp.]|nr:Macrolide export ATP-binding/permease protein MacB [Labilithrix sp.]
MTSSLRFFALSLVLCGQSVRSLLRHKGRTALSAIGIAIAIAAVVWVVALGRAGAAQATALLQDLGDNLVWVEAGSRNVAGVRTGAKSTSTLTLGDAEAIAREVTLIQNISPQVDGNVQLVSPRSNWSTRSRGVAAAYLTIKRFSLASGAVFTDEDIGSARNVLLMGQTVRERLFGTENPVGQVVRMNGQPFEVVGLLAPKGQSATGADQDDVVMVPYTTANRKLRPVGQAWLDDIVCSAASPEAVAPAVLEITSLMRERHRIGEGQEDDFNIRHPEEVVKAQMAATETFSTLLASIASVSLLVGGIGIMNVMLASVSERTREIGVRLAVGATARAITLQFLVEAVLLSMLGGALGLAVSVAGSSTLARAVGWSLPIPTESFALAFVFSAVVGVAFGYLPARHASRLDPIEALRSE